MPWLILIELLAKSLVKKTNVALARVEQDFPGKWHQLIQELKSRFYHSQTLGCKRLGCDDFLAQNI